MAVSTTKRTSSTKAKTTRRSTKTTAKKSTAAKTKTAAALKTTTTTAAAPTTSAAPSAAEAVAPATIVTEEAIVAAPDLKKNVYIDRVVARTGLKKKDVKPVVEAALELLGDAIAAGEPLNLPGFGKLKVNRAKELANGRVMICKLRQPKKQEEPKNSDEV